MFVRYRSQGIIFKKEDRGEADQIFTTFTKEFGKLEILGKAIRKIKSKLRGGAETFYLSEIEFIQGKTHKILTDAILIENFKNIRKDLKRLKIAHQIAETLDNLIKEQEKDEKIWDLLSETFNKLDSYKLEAKSYKLIYYYFLWNLISILGYGIELYHCVLCRERIKPQTLFFDPEEGGIVCNLCFRKRRVKKPQVKAIEPEVIKFLRIILTKNWQTLKKLKIEEKILKSLERISKNYLNFLLGRFF